MQLSLLALLVSAAAASQHFPVPRNAKCLYQDDFATGTKIISSHGVYKLCEDISFGPNGPAPGMMPDEDAFDPLPSGPFSENGYGLGFFSAIAITTSDVILHLNGHTIEQSAGHALMQRYFAVIELASSPFISTAGPAQFVGEGEVFAPASKVQILGPGTIGRSSHHGIHGNDNADVKIAAVEFRDFEVAAVSLNNVDSLKISDCNLVHNRQDVPVVGMFSAARFIRPYGKELAKQDYEMKMYDSKTGIIVTKKAKDVYANLIKSINNVYKDVVIGSGYINKDTHPEEYHLYDNPFRVIDGPCYAFLVHGRGPAVGGQGQILSDNDGVTSSNVIIKNNNIDSIKCWNNEVPALAGVSDGGHGFVMNDARGAIFQTVKTFDSENPSLALGQDGLYNGTVVSDMQLMVAKAILDGTLTDMPSRQTGTNSISQNLIDWASSNLNKWVPDYVCNGDSMHHVVKGAIIIRVEETHGFHIEQNTITNVTNLSVKPFTACNSLNIGASAENSEEQQAGNARVISVAAVSGYSKKSKSQIKNNNIQNVTSLNGNVVVGIDVQGVSSDVGIVNNIVDLQGSIVVTESPSNADMIAVRAREAVDGSVTMHGNHLHQKTKVLNAPGVRGRRARALKNLHEHGHASGDIEWKAGGCPFAAEYAKK